jgi:hypothetical protein
MEKARNRNKDLCNFGLILAAILLVIGVRLFFKTQQVYVGYFATSAVIGACSLFCPAILRPVYSVFIGVAHVIGWINTKILLIATFYLIMAPIGLFVRLTGRDLLGLRVDKSGASYWTPRPQKSQDPSKYEKQF